MYTYTYIYIYIYIYILYIYIYREREIDSGNVWYRRRYEKRPKGNLEGTQNTLCVDSRAHVLYCAVMCIGPCIVPEGTKRATSVNMQLCRLQKDLRYIVNLPSELRSRRGGIFTEVAHLVPPE